MPGVSAIVAFSLTLGLARSVRRGPALLFAALCALVPGSAQATYSIVAVDTRDGTMGAAVASCVDLETVERVYGVVPGKGALVTQSYLKDGANAEGLALLAGGTPPNDVLLALLDPTYDPEYELRQYAVVDVAGDLAAYTGPGALAYANMETFEVDGYVVSIQGNILTGPSVIDGARSAFEAGGCDLADRLMRSLEAAGRSGQGDNRCAVDGVPAKSMTLDVDPPGSPAGSFLRLAHESPGDPPRDDPTVTIRASFDTWRSAHPCPAVDPPMGGGPGSFSPSDTERPNEARSDGCLVASSPPSNAASWPIASIFLAVLLLMRRRR